MVRPPADHFFSNQQYLHNGPLIVAIIIHTTPKNENSPYETFFPSVLEFILCSNTPYTQSPKKNLTEHLQLSWIDVWGKVITRIVVPCSR